MTGTNGRSKVRSLLSGTFAMAHRKEAHPVDASPIPAQLATVAAVLSPTLRIDRRPRGDEFYEALDRDYDSFAGHTLISEYSFDGPWGVWEMHPKGDELVYLLSGTTDFLLRRESGDERLTLSEPGSYVVVPKGVWHTAEPKTPTRMLFITPGEGTQNLESPPL